MNMGKRRMEVYLMVGALLLMFVGIPLGVWAGNSFNNWISPTYTYEQVENVTDFLEAPSITADIEDEFEYRFATADGELEASTEETPTWDDTLEWDTIVLTGNTTDMVLMMNLNFSVEDLMNGKDFQLRYKQNFSKETTFSIYAVKSDGVEVTKVLAYTSHIGNESQTVYWNWTPSDILGLKTTLDAELTDVQYMQIVITGFDDDNALEVADIIEFQIALGGTGAVYSFSSWQILTGVATITGILLILVGFASTPYWNPLSNGRRSSGGSAPQKRRRSYRRR